MAKILVNNSGPLHGEVWISGAKNSVLPLLAATIMTTDTCVIEDVPDLADVNVMKKMLLKYGAKIDDAEEGTIRISTPEIISCEGDRVSAHDILEYAEVMVAKEHAVHLQLHGDPHDKTNPDVIYWRSRLENTIAVFDSKMKVYDFTLRKNNDGSVEFKEKVANHGWQWNDVSPVQRKRWESLPDSYKENGKINGHMASHQLLIDDFCTAAYEKKLPYVNAWRAARFTIPGLIAHESAKLGGVPLDIPDFGDAPFEETPFEK
jgi:hypothetical protein